MASMICLTGCPSYRHHALRMAHSLRRIHCPPSLPRERKVWKNMISDTYIRDRPGACRRTYVNRRAAISLTSVRAHLPVLSNTFILRQSQPHYAKGQLQGEMFLLLEAFRQREGPEVRCLRVNPGCGPGQTVSSTDAAATGSYGTVRVTARRRRGDRTRRCAPRTRWLSGRRWGRAGS